MPYRTPEERFADLPDFPFAPNYVSVGGDLRMHYVDEGTGAPILCLHGEQPDVVVDDAGHFLPDERGPTVARHVRRFVDRAA